MRNSHAPNPHIITTDEEEKRPNWKPIVFSPLFHLTLAIVHILHLVGIQLLISRHHNDEPELDRILKNETVTNPESIFVFEEDDSATFITWTYLPVSIALIVAALWEVLDLTVRRLEPFHQLSSNGGGTAWNALCIEYGSLFGLTTPFKALARQHYPVVLTSVAFILVSIVVPAITGSIFSIEWGTLSFSSAKTEGPKLAVVSMDSGLAVATQALHGVCAGLSIVIGIILLLRSTGLYRDPKGLGALASLVSDADQTGLATLHIFRAIPSCAHSDDISRFLEGINFRLARRPILNREGLYSQTYQLQASIRPGHVYPSIADSRWSRGDANGLWLSRRMAWLAEFLLWLGQAAIITAIYYTSRVFGPDGWAQSSKLTISKTVLTVCITIGGMMWLSIQRSLQAFEPWRQLCRKSNVRATSLTHGNPASLGVLGSATSSITMGSFMMLWASFCVFMVQTITVFVPPLMELGAASGITENEVEYREVGVLAPKKALAMVGTGIAIHITVFLNLIFLTFNGRTRPFLPRAPTTMASQLVYLCRSDRLLSDFSGTSMLSQKDLERRLESLSGRYRFGWIWWEQRRAWHVGVERHDNPNYFQEYAAPRK